MRRSLAPALSVLRRCWIASLWSTPSERWHRCLSLAQSPSQPIPRTCLSQMASPGSILSARSGRAMQGLHLQQCDHAQAGAQTFAGCLTSARGRHTQGGSLMYDACLQEPYGHRQLGDCLCIWRGRHDCVRHARYSTLAAHCKRVHDLSEQPSRGDDDQNLILSVNVAAAGQRLGIGQACSGSLR